MKNISNELLFTSLFKAKTEEEVERIIDKYPDVFNNDNWFPLGGSESMFGIVRNQQSNPIAALVEKVTNSIDAILTKKCLKKKYSQIRLMHHSQWKRLYIFFILIIRIGI